MPPALDTRRVRTPLPSRPGRRPVLSLALALAGAAAALVPGCDGSLASGNVESSVGPGGHLPAGIGSRVVIGRTRDVATGAVAGRFRATVTGDIRGGTVRLPDRTVLPLDLVPGANPPAFEAAFDGDEEGLRARFPAGLYFFEVTLPNGSARAFGTFVSGDLPPFPDLVEPADGATGVPALATFRWTGEGPRFDLVVRPVPAAGPFRTIVAATTEREAQAQAGALAPGTAHEAEIRAVRGPETRSFQLESGALSRFTTGG